MNPCFHHWRYTVTALSFLLRLSLGFSQFDSFHFHRIPIVCHRCLLFHSFYHCCSLGRFAPSYFCLASRVVVIPTTMLKFPFIILLLCFLFFDVIPFYPAKVTIMSDPTFSSSKSAISRFNSLLRVSSRPFRRFSISFSSCFFQRPQYWIILYFCLLSLSSFCSYSSAKSFNCITNSSLSALFPCAMRLPVLYNARFIGKMER